MKGLEAWAPTAEELKVAGAHPLEEPLSSSSTVGGRWAFSGFDISGGDDGDLVSHVSLFLHHLEVMEFGRGKGKGPQTHVTLVGGVWVRGKL